MLSEGQGDDGLFVHAQALPEMTYTAASQKMGIPLSHGIPGPRRRSRKVVHPRRDALQDSTTLHPSTTERMQQKRESHEEG